MQSVREPKVVYVSGAYTAATHSEVAANVARADRAGRDLLAKGHVPLVPHSLSRFWEADDRFVYEDFLRMDLALLHRCDWLLYLGSSPGADRELAEARERGMPVFFSVDEVPAVEGFGE